MTFQKQFQEILSSENFERLDAYKNSEQWEEMTSEERELLAKLFLKQGEAKLKAGESNIIEYFELAQKAAPQSAKISFQIGCAYATQIKNPSALVYACKAFKRTTDLDPTLFDAWFAWAKVLTHLGAIHQESLYFHESHQHFQRAHSLMPTSSETTKLFFEDWGRCCHFLGTLSGEAVDFHTALDKYRRAVASGGASADLHNECGNVITELAFLIGRKELFLEAANDYKSAVQIDPESPRGWANLSCCYERIFEATGDQQYFDLANEHFKEATTLDAQNGGLWLAWGQLYSSSGKLHKDPDIIRMSFTKFENADQLLPNNPLILCRWAEALTLCGANAEEVELLRAAEEKIKKCVEILPDQSEPWYVYGACLNELGRYFADEEFYLQAIEKFHYGLALSQSDPLLWYGLALAHFAIGELKSSSAMVEKATRYFSRVLEFGGHIFPQLWNDWGIALMKLAEMTNLKEHVEAAIEKFEYLINQYQGEGEEDRTEPEWLYNYGCALDFLGDLREDIACYEKAVHMLSKAVQMDPNYTHARYNLGLALSHLGETVGDLDILHKAHEQFQLLLTIDPEDEMGWNDWGLTLIHVAELIHDPARPEQSQKIFEIAESKLLHAIALGCVYSYYNLACLYSLMGNFSEAMAFLEKAYVAQSLPAMEDLMHDEWLDSLRQTPSFRQFLDTLKIKDES